MTAIDTTTRVLRSRDRRISWLVGAHLLLAVMPVTLVFLPAREGIVNVVLSTMNSTLAAQTMLLSFWGGFGNGKLGLRLVAVLMGVVYADIWFSLGLFLFSAVQQPVDYLAMLGMIASTNLLIALPITAAFLAARRWWSELRFLPEADDRTATPTVQFSILNILIITTVAAILVAFMRGARRNTGTDAQMLPLLALTVSTFVINALCAVWAALGIGRVRWRVVLALTVAALLGLLLSITARETTPWWLMVTWSVVSVLLIAIVVGSLWAVRSCGYRLVPKSALGK